MESERWRARKLRSRRRRALHWRRCAAPARCAQSGFRSHSRRRATDPRSAPFEPRRPARIPLSPSHASAIPIGSRTEVSISRSLAAVGSRAKRSAAQSSDPLLEVELAELAEQVEEIVGDGLAERVVIHRAQRPTEIARALPARAAIGSCGVFERLESPAPSVSLRFFALNSRPPWRGFLARS